MPSNGQTNGSSPSTIDYDRFISARAKRYEPAAIRGLFPLELRPGMISLLAGKPNPETFPIESMVVNLLPLNGKTPLPLTIQGSDLQTSLQYSATAGLPRLVKFLEGFQSHVHGRGDPQTEGWRVTVGSGSQDSLSKAFQAVIDEGDSVLLETPCYPGTIGCLHGQPCELVEIHSDSEGILPSHLEEVLSSWPSSKKFPKVVYTMPVGANPGGTTASKKRKLDILKIVKTYDLLIFEDDAYYFLYYGDAPQAPSYFALEMEANSEIGRVIRFDSFSKIVSSGLRLGFTTAPKAFCDRVDLITANTNLQVSSLTQAIGLALFERWGIDGLLEHCQRVAQFYRKKKDAFEAIAKKHLDGLATWTSPSAGMFLYLDLKLPSKDSEELIKTKAVDAGFLAVPGTACLPSKGKSSCVRTSFSLAQDDTTEEAFRRLAKLLKQENGIEA